MAQLTRQQSIQRIHNMAEFQTHVLYMEAIQFIYPENRRPERIQKLFANLQGIVAKSSKSRQNGVVIKWGKKFLKAHLSGDYDFASYLLAQKSNEQYNHYEYVAQRVIKVVNNMKILKQKYPLLPEPQIQPQSQPEFQQMFFTGDMAPQIEPKVKSKKVSSHKRTISSYDIRPKNYRDRTCSI